MKRTMEDEDDDEMTPAVWTLTSQSRNNNMVVADITNIDWSDVCGEAEITVSESAQGDRYSSVLNRAIPWRE